MDFFTQPVLASQFDAVFPDLQVSLVKLRPRVYDRHAIDACLFHSVLIRPLAPLDSSKKR